MQRFTGRFGSLCRLQGIHRLKLPVWLVRLAAPFPFCLAALAASAVLVAPQAVLAQYPDRPIRLIVPQAAGSASDNLARLLAIALGEQLGRQVIVDNRPGGALTIGIDATARAVPDGYTIGLGPVGALAITRHMVSRLPYNIERDLQPVALASTGNIMLAVSPSLGVNSVRELIDYAKKNPG